MDNLSKHKGIEAAVERNAVLSVLVVGVIMAAIDSTIVILALPTIDSNLSTSPVTSIWIIMSYILVLTVLSAQAGKLGDRFGRSKLYNYGLLIFVVGSALCGASLNIIMLIASRIIQAVGGAFVSTNSSAVVSDHFKPHERGKAFGLTSMGWNIGAIIGIFLGGFLATIDWRLIFLINIPIGIVILPIAFKKLKDVAEKRKELFDIKGSVLLGVALVLFTIMAVLSMYGGITTTVVLLLVASIIFIGLFLFVQVNAKFPTIDFSLFKSRIFTFSVLASALQFMASFAILFILILYLQGVRGLNPLLSSVYLLPGYVVGGILAVMSGRLSDKIGARIPATIGLILIAIGYIFYIIFITPTSPIYYIALITILTGFGSGLFWPANISAIMSNTPSGKYGMGAGVNRLLNNIGMVMSFVIALTIISSSIPRQTAFSIFLGTQINSAAINGGAFISGLDSALIASVMIIIIAAIISAVRGKENRMKISMNGL